MATVMLLTSILPTAALAISAPTEEEPMWKIEYKDGVLSARINAEMLYEILEDKTLTKDELQKLIPSDILELIQNKNNINANAIADLLSNYVDADTLKDILDDIPVEVLREFIDKELVEAVLSIEDIVSLIDVEAILESADEDDVEAMFNGKPMKKVLTDSVRARLLELDFGKVDIDFETISVSEIVEVLGGYGELIKLYSEEELFNIVLSVAQNEENIKLVLNDVPKNLIFTEDVREAIVDSMTFEEMVALFEDGYHVLLDLYTYDELSAILRLIAHEREDDIEMMLGDVSMEHLLTDRVEAELIAMDVDPASVNSIADLALAFANGASSGDGHNGYENLLGL